MIGTGKHGGPKNPRPQGAVGSNPTPGTTLAGLQLVTSESMQTRQDGEHPAIFSPM